MNQPDHLIHGKMLDHLGAEDSAQRLIRQRFHMFQVSLDDIEALVLATKDHIEVTVEAMRLDARFSQKVEKLASTAAQVKDIFVLHEVLYIEAQSLLDVL